MLLGFAVFIFFDDFRYNIVKLDYRILREGTPQVISTLCLLSFLLFLISYHLASFYKTSKERSNKSYNILFKRFDYIVIPISILIQLIYYYYESDYQQNSYFQFITYISKSAIIISFYFYFLTKKKKYLFLVTLLLSISFFESSRRIYLAMFLIMSVIFFANLYKTKKIKFSYKIAFMLVAIIFFIFLNALRSSHNYGTGYIPNDPVTNTMSYIKDLRIADTFYNAGFVYETFPTRFKYYYGITYTGPFVGLIPRNFWPEKPRGFGADLGFMQQTNFPLVKIEDWIEINMYSLSPGFIGEAMANFGIYGIILLSILLGIFTKYFDVKYRVRHILDDVTKLPIVLVYPALLLIFRGDFYSALLYPIFLYIFIKLIFLFIVKKNVR